MSDKPKWWHGSRGLGGEWKGDHRKSPLRSLFSRSAREIDKTVSSHEASNAKSGGPCGSGGPESFQPKVAISADQSGEVVPEASSSQNPPGKPTALAGVSQPSMDQTTQPADPKSIDDHAEDASPADPDGDNPKTLWDKAYARLRKENLLLVEAYQDLLASTASIPKGLPVRETMTAVVNNRVEVMTKGAWKIRIPWRQEPVIVRDLVDKIVHVVLKFKDVANVAASVDPIHIGIPVAGICVLLPFITGDSQERESALKGLDMIADLVDLYSEVEKVYPNVRESRVTKKFSGKLEDLYFQVLDFLARAACSFDRDTLSRVAINILKIEDWGGKLEEIKAANKRCQAFANEYHWLEQRTGLEVINDLVQKQAQAIQQVLAEIRLHSDQSRKIISWVSEIDFEATHDRTREKLREKLGDRYQNSGQWLQPRYSAWLESTDKPTLWLCGSVGTGKSSLVSQVIEWRLKEIETTGKERAAYFYCASAKSQSTTSSDVLHSLVAQLAWSPDRSSVEGSVKAIYEKEPGKRSKLDWDLLTGLISRYQRTTIIIDALDECGDRDSLLLQLQRVCNSSQSAVKFFFSSRPNVKLREFPSWVKIELDSEKELREDDMKTYIHTQVKDRVAMRIGYPLLDGKRPDLEERLIETLTSRAQGMFRWTELQLARFFPEYPGDQVSEDVEDALDKLMNETGDPDLDEVYSQIFDMNTKASKRSRAIAVRAFQWMMCAQRPLQISELAEASAANQSEQTKRDVNSNYILQICSNFIIADASNVAHFAHLSVREYLEKRRAEEIKKGSQDQINREDEMENYSQEHVHTIVAETCLPLLINPPMPISAIKDFGNGLLTYAVLYWAVHWERSPDRRGSSSLGKRYAEFLAKGQVGSPLMNWLEALPRAAKSLPYGQNTLRNRLLLSDSSPSRFLTACAWGFIEVLRNSLGASDLEPANANKNRISDALEVACLYAQDEVAQLLISNGARITINTLRRAVDSGSEVMVGRILENGAKVNETDQYGETALLYAVLAENCPIARLLLKNGANTRAKFPRLDLPEFPGVKGPYDTANSLHIAADKGNLEMVRLLLDHGADITAYTEWGNGGTALDLALDGYHEEVVRVLVEKKMGLAEEAALHWARREGLHRAATYGNKTAALQILNKGGDVNVQNEHGQTALHATCRYREVEVAQLLLDHGADVHIRDKHGRTPLHVTSWKIGSTHVKLLLDHGAEINARDEKGRTALHELAHSGDGPSVKILLEMGADFEAKDVNNKTPLHEATRPEIVELLLEKGANVAAETCDGWTALHFAAQRGEEKVVDLLLKQDGVNPNPRSKDGSTPLSLAVKKRREFVVERLLEYGGVDWDSKGENGYLWDAIRDGEEATVQGLIECGQLNVKERDKFETYKRRWESTYSRTLLHSAAARGYLASVRMLLQKGSDVKLTDSHGDTPLHSAIWSGKNTEQIICLLLENGADIDARNTDGDTPIHIAVYDGKQKAFESLLDRGANTNTRNNDGKTTLDFANANEHGNMMVRMLANRETEHDLDDRLP